MNVLVPLTAAVLIILNVAALCGGATKGAAGFLDLATAAMLLVLSLGTGRGDE